MKSLSAKGIPIGGTSAGEIILSEFSYTAQFASITSKDALQDPYNIGLTLGTQFLSLPFMTNIVNDAHFAVRDRMGRLLTFMARAVEDVFCAPPIRGIGVDEGTALLIDSDGYASMAAWETSNSVYLLSSVSLPERCKPTHSLTFTNITTVKFSGNASKIFDFSSWSPLSAPTANYTLSVKNGKISSTQKGGRIY